MTEPMRRRHCIQWAPHLKTGADPVVKGQGMGTYPIRILFGVVAASREIGGKAGLRAAADGA